MELFSDKRILTVTQLTALVRGVLEDNFECVWVEGEVSNLAMPGSGHIYFTIKDSGAQLRCVMFRSSAKAMKFKPRDGMGMIVRGRLTVYEQRGEYQLVVEYMEPRGVGALQLAFIQLKERLAKEGLFDEAHKKPVPSLPQRIGVVTSATGAAIHDILNVLNRRFANVEVLLYPVKVQGEGAAEEIAAAVRDFNRYREVDVLIVGRGGGSLEDLWAFNEEAVARAIFASEIPVISAVGHEVDFTIADFVADMRAPTPSSAAELVVKSKAEIAAELDSLRHRLGQVMKRRMTGLDGRLNALTQGLKDPSMLLGHLAQRMDDLGERFRFAWRGGVARKRDRLAAIGNHLRLMSPALQLERNREQVALLADRGLYAMRRNLDQAGEAVAVMGGKLNALSPLNTLARGYAIATMEPEGAVVKRSSQLETGDLLTVRFHIGSAECRVEKKH
jgi:exodeoxyribonuclease VII large subunit